MRRSAADAALGMQRERQTGQSGADQQEGGKMIAQDAGGTDGFVGAGQDGAVGLFRLLADPAGVADQQAAAGRRVAAEDGTFLHMRAGVLLRRLAHVGVADECGQRIAADRFLLHGIGGADRQYAMTVCSVRKQQIFIRLQLVLSLVTG